MFANHQPKISAYARQNPDNFARTLRFVVLTIRNRLFNIPAEMETLDAALYGWHGGQYEESEIRGILMGSKQAAVSQIESEKDFLFWEAERIVYCAQSEREAARELIRLFAEIHGIGLAKAGFCAQLIYGVGGCLDSHNLERFGINPNHIKSSTYKNAKTSKTRDKYLERYLDYCDKFGGTESLWDSWCEYVFARPDETGFRMNGNESFYKSAFHVSELHFAAIVETAETGTAAAMVAAA